MSCRKEGVREDKWAFGAAKARSKREQQGKKNKISTCHYFPCLGMISTYFTLPVLDCSPLFLTIFLFILVLKCGHLILCIFVKSKTDFYAFLLIPIWFIYLCLWIIWAFFYSWTTWIWIHHWIWFLKIIVLFLLIPTISSPSTFMEWS